MNADREKETVGEYVRVFDELDGAYEKVSGGLVSMMANADQWCISSTQVREDEVEQEVSEGLAYPHTYLKKR